MALTSIFVVRDIVSKLGFSEVNMDVLIDWIGSIPVYIWVLILICLVWPLLDLIMTYWYLICKKPFLGKCCKNDMCLNYRSCCLMFEWWNCD